MANLSKLNRKRTQDLFEGNSQSRTFVGESTSTSAGSSAESARGVSADSVTDASSFNPLSSDPSIESDSAAEQFRNRQQVPRGDANLAKSTLAGAYDQHGATSSSLGSSAESTRGVSVDSAADAASFDSLSSDPSVKGASGAVQTQDNSASDTISDPQDQKDAALTLRQEKARSGSKGGKGKKKGLADKVQDQAKKQAVKSAASGIASTVASIISSLLFNPFSLGAIFVILTIVVLYGKYPKTMKTVFYAIGKGGSYATWAFTKLINLVL
jgi:hypothetical protein